MSDYITEVQREQPVFQKPKRRGRVTAKELASAIVMTSPLWGIVVNVFIFRWIARNMAHGRSIKPVAMFIVIYIAMLLSLAIYAGI